MLEIGIHGNRDASPPLEAICNTITGKKDEKEEEKEEKEIKKKNKILYAINLKSGNPEALSYEDLISNNYKLSK